MFPEQPLNDITSTMTQNVVVLLNNLKTLKTTVVENGMNNWLTNGS